MIHWLGAVAIGLGGVFLGIMMVALLTCNKQAELQEQAWRAGYQAAKQEGTSREPD